ncbi:MAG: BrnT family toxin, partial [Phormidium sp.]
MNHLRFGWDSVKARQNIQKHGISFEDATSVFNDPLALIFEDGRYAYGECREIIIGHDRQN